jgi:hypothetical protein
MNYSSTRAYESKLVPDVFFKDSEGAIDFDTKQAVSKVASATTQAIEAALEGNDDVLATHIQYLADAIKERDTDRRWKRSKETLAAIAPVGAIATGTLDGP